eukprot:1231905-Pleurochrysis_carterae.AAC.1
MITRKDVQPEIIEERFMVEDLDALAKALFHREADELEEVEGGPPKNAAAASVVDTLIGQHGCQGLRNCSQAHERAPMSTCRA